MAYPFKEEQRVSQKYDAFSLWYKNWGNRHKGIDFATVGTEVLAIADGVVLKSYLDGGKGYGYGNLIIINHDKLGIKSYSGHLSKRFKKEGDRVDCGEVIGLSGNTGFSTAPHFHLGTRNWFAWVNPQSYIDLPCQNNIINDIHMTYEELLTKLPKEGFVKKDERFCYYPDGKPVIVNNGKRYFPDLGDMGVVYMKFARPIRDIEKTYTLTTNRKEVLT